MVDDTDRLNRQEGLPFDDAVDRVAVEEQSVRFKRTQARVALEGDNATPYVSNRPCPECGTTEAYLVVKASQNTVRCASCWTHIYNAPKTETGQKARTVKTLRKQIKPGQQARILDRDHGRCILCGTFDDLQIGHLLSVKEGLRLGADEALLYDDANLAAMCEACNIGLNERSVSPRTFAVLMHRLVQAEQIRRLARSAPPLPPAVGLRLD